MVYCKLQYRKTKCKSSEIVGNHNLSGQDHFDNNDINTVIRLISAADKHNSERDDEAIIVDADSLSKLCVEHVQEKYTAESYFGIIDLWQKELPKRFKTEKGKSIYPELLENLQKNLL
jgi:hypothetical protein